VNGEVHGASSAQPPGEPARGFREDPGGSGWTTTKQAAKVLGVSRRSVQGYVGRGILEAREEGEGVNRRFLISIDSLNSLADLRRCEANEPASFVDDSPEVGNAATAFANTGEGLRHLIERLEARTAEAAELRIRLELTERAQSTLEEELAEANRRREEAERELAELRRRVGVVSEPSDPYEAAADEPEGAEPRPSTEDAKEPRSSPLKGWHVAALVVLISMASFGVLLYLAVTVLSP